MHHIPAEVFLQVDARHIEQAEDPHQHQGGDAQAQAPVQLVPLFNGREGAQNHPGKDGKADQNAHSGQSANLDVLKAVLQPRLVQPPAGNALLRQKLAERVPDNNDNQGVEQQLDQPRRHQIALGQHGGDKNRGADEAA